MPQSMIVPVSEAQRLTQASNCSESSSVVMPPGRTASLRHVSAPYDRPFVPVCEDNPPGRAPPTLTCDPTGDAESVGVPVAPGVGERDGVILGCAPGAVVLVGVVPGVTVSVGVSDGVGVYVGVGVGVAACVGVTTGVGVGTGIVGVGVTTGVTVGIGVTTGVGVTAGLVGDGVGDGRRAGVDVATGVGVCRGRGVGVTRVLAGIVLARGVGCGVARLLAVLITPAVPVMKHGSGTVICVLVAVAVNCAGRLVGVEPEKEVAVIVLMLVTPVTLVVLDGTPVSRLCTKSAPHALPAVITSRDILILRLRNTRVITLKRPFQPLFHNAIKVLTICSYPSPHTYLIGYR